eukprot:XP_001695158.1 predicted protein [Chlamydomonas reinhardtii]
MLNCLTYCAFVYWAVATVHTILPIDVAVCGADPERGGLGALLHHTFGGEVDIDADTWRGYPCHSHLVAKVLFILQRPVATVTHIMTGGGQGEPFVPILFVVPIIFMLTVLLREGLGLRIISPTASRTLLKFGIAVGCRTMILLKSLLLGKSSLYYKRYSKVEFFIIAWTAYIIEIPVPHEAAVSGGTAVIIAAMAALFPHHFLPEVNPINVALQAIAATVFALVNASHQQRRRVAERNALAAPWRRLKLSWAHLADLPPDLLARINTHILASSGWQVTGGAGAVSACAREGCVELVLDLRPRQPRRLPYGAQPGTSLQRAGLLRPDCEPSVVLHVGLLAPVIEWLSPRAACRHAAAEAAGVPGLRLTVAVRGGGLGPAELLGGSGVLVRGPGGRLLPYTALSVSLAYTALTSVRGGVGRASSDVSATTSPAAHSSSPGAPRGKALQQYAQQQLLAPQQQPAMGCRQRGGLLPPLAGVWELVWGFGDADLERRFAQELSCQSRAVVQVLLRWHQRLADSGATAGSSSTGGSSNPWLARAAYTALTSVRGGVGRASSDVSATTSPAAHSSSPGAPRGKALQQYAQQQLLAPQQQPAMGCRQRGGLLPPLAGVWELVWGFGDADLERRFAQELSCQANTTPTGRRPGGLRRALLAVLLLTTATVCAVSRARFKRRQAATDDSTRAAVTPPTAAAPAREPPIPPRPSACLLVNLS